MEKETDNNALTATIGGGEKNDPRVFGGSDSAPEVFLVTNLHHRVASHILVLRCRQGHALIESRERGEIKVATEVNSEQKMERNCG